MTPASTIRAPRWLHPGAWWLWALGLATAASRTTNPLLLLLILGVAGYVVAARRPDAPWSRSFAVLLRLGLIVIGVRVIFQALLGAPMGTHTLLGLPSVPLPEWLAGVRLGGDFTVEALLFAVYEGLRLATLLACVGAATSLASPSRLLRSVPAALYTLGVTVVVTLSFTPTLVGDLHRIRDARRLRGRPSTGLRGITGAALPVLEGALERSVTLAAAMDSRGYGRVAALPRRTALTSQVLVLGGLLGVCVGVYGLLDGGSPGAFGLPVLALGLAAALVGLGFGGRSRVRTRYRPDPWAWPEWVVAGSGAAAALALVAAGVLGVAGLQTPVDPPAWPALPLLPAAGILLALLPAVAAPPVPLPMPPRQRPARLPMPPRQRPVRMPQAADGDVRTGAATIGTSAARTGTTT